MKNINIVSNKRLYNPNITILNQIYLIHLKKYFIRQKINFVFLVFEEFQKGVNDYDQNIKKYKEINPKEMFNKKFNEKKLFQKNLKKFF